MDLADEMAASTIPVIIGVATPDAQSTDEQVMLSSS